MTGESLRSPGLGPDVDSIQARLGGRFRIRGMLPWGQTVPYFRAELDGEPVVLATLPVDCHADPETEAAFLCAAFDFAALSGRGLPEVVDHGVADGMPYLAYRAPVGRLLSSLLARGPLSSRLLLRVGEAILDALSVCHRHGMAHGELCPENILVDDPERDGAASDAVADDGPVVTLLGVGLIPLVFDARARAHERSSGPAPSSSAYKAPELLGGAAPTPAADQYALGALLHHMVSGRPPEGFETSNVYADVPALVDVVRRAMSRDPARRYENASTMRAALDWVEIESEKMSAHTQDIPLWMEHSIVGNIPVPELLRAKSSAPPRGGHAGDSVELPLPAPLPHMRGPGTEPRVRLDGTNPRIRLDGTNPRVRLDGTNPSIRLDPSDPSIRIVFDDAEPTPVAPRARSRRRGLPLWAQDALATVLVVGAGVIAWVLTG